MSSHYIFDEPEREDLDPKRYSGGIDPFETAPPSIPPFVYKRLLCVLPYPILLVYETVPVVFTRYAICWSGLCSRSDTSSPD